MSAMKKSVVMLGAGSAGLIAAYEMLQKSGEWNVTVL